MSINCTDKGALEDFLSANLKEIRYRHSLGVEEMAVRLANLHGADEEKAAGSLGGLDTLACGYSAYPLVVTRRGND